MEILKAQIEKLLSHSCLNKQIIDTFTMEQTIYPFSDVGKELAFLLSQGLINYNDYLYMCNEYFKRNKYLNLFDLSPRTFGETWGEQHVLSLYPEFIKATTGNLKSLYPFFDGEFDLWLSGQRTDGSNLSGIRIEVKSCRANSNAKKGSLSSRAFSHSQAKNAGFKYHFQQLKPTCCDVFIWIGVCKDELLYWVLTSQDLIDTQKLGPQHRSEQTGLPGAQIYEGQVFMTEEELEPFLTSQSELLKMVKWRGNIYPY